MGKGTVVFALPSITPVRRYIAGEDIEIGTLVTRDRKWYQFHWRVRRMKYPWDNPIGIAQSFISKGQTITAADLAIGGRVVINE